MISSVTADSGAFTLRLFVVIAANWFIGPFAKLSKLILFAAIGLLTRIEPKELDPVPAVSWSVPVLPVKVIG